MKNFLTLVGSLSLIFLASAGIVRAQDKALLVMPGTETPESHTSGESGECFVFEKYVIKTNASEDGGANISLFTSGDRLSATPVTPAATHGSTLQIRIIIPFLDCPGNTCSSTWVPQSTREISISTTLVFTNRS